MCVSVCGISKSTNTQDSKRQKDQRRAQQTVGRAACPLVYSSLRHDYSLTWVLYSLFCSVSSSRHPRSFVFSFSVSPLGTSVFVCSDTAGSVELKTARIHCHFPQKTPFFSTGISFFYKTDLDQLTGLPQILPPLSTFKRDNFHTAKIGST